MNKKGQWARKYKLQVTENGIVRELFSQTVHEISEQRGVLNEEESQRLESSCKIIGTVVLDTSLGWWGKQRCGVCVGKSAE